MFRNWDEKCKSSAVHKEHWRWTRDLNRLWCPGVMKYEAKTELERWVEANPHLSSSVRERAKEFMSAVNDYNIDLSELDHKHFYKLVTTLITPRGYWQCDCWDICVTDHEAYKKEALRKVVNQTWPD